MVWWFVFLYPRLPCPSSTYTPVFESGQREMTSNNFADCNGHVGYLPNVSFSPIHLQSCPLRGTVPTLSTFYGLNSTTVKPMYWSPNPQLDKSWRKRRDGVSWVNLYLTWVLKDEQVLYSERERNCASDIRSNVSIHTKELNQEPLKRRVRVSVKSWSQDNIKH